MFKKMLLILSIFLFVCTGPLSGIVQGVNAREIEVDLRSSISSEYDISMRTVNAGNYSAVNEFKEVLNNNGLGSGGIYWGSSLPSYRLNYGFNGMNMLFSVTFHFTRQDIQLGASSYWIRIPVDGTNIERIAVYAENRTVTTIPDYSESIAIVNNDPDLKRAIFDTTGIYLNLNYIIYPGISSFSFFLEAYPDLPIIAYVSNEIYSIGQSKYIFYSIRDEKYPGVTEYKVSNVKEEILPSTPPVSFLFQTGNDINGWSSMWLKSGDKIRFTGSYDPITYNLNNKYPSFYFPFRSTETVNFQCHFEFLTPFGALGLTNPYTNTSHYSVDFSLNTQRDYVLFSTQYYLNESAFGGFLYSSHYWNIDITPDREISLLFRNTSKKIDGAQIFNYFGDGLGNARYYKLFFVTDIQTGAWARVTNYNMVSFIDFGWSTGYRFPGYTEVYIFLDTGASVFFNGTAQDIWDRVLEEEYTISQAIEDAIKGAVQWLADDYLKNVFALGRKVSQIFEWFNDFVDYLIGFKDFITQLIGSVLDFFMNIVLGLVVALGLIVPQFVSSAIENREEEETIRDAIKKELKPFKEAMLKGNKEEEKENRKKHIKKVLRNHEEG